MKRFGIPTLLISFGILIGVPAGYFFAPTGGSSVASSDAANPDILKLTLPRNFFADLPQIGSGNDRLVSVDTFTNAYLGAVVIPTFPQHPKPVGPLQLPPVQR